MSDRIIVNLIGGVGNQMFQYAFGYSLSKISNLPLHVDISSYKDYKIRNFELEKFFAPLNYASDEDCAALKKKHVFKKTWFKEREQIFYPKMLKVKSGGYFRGFWQSEKYFKEYREEIIENFTFRDFDFIKNDDLLNEIKNTNSVSINLRLCEYVNDPVIKDKHFVCTKKYYENAINYAKSKIQRPVFYVFSDDLEEAKNYLPGGENYIFANTQNWQEDLYFMQSAKHNIIANSSFSWWAAWLNKNPDKITIAPEIWYTPQSKVKFKDVIPDNWVKIPVN